MGKTQIGAIFAAAVIVTIVAADVIFFFRHHAAERLAVNVGIVLVYAAFYWRFFKRF